MRHRMLHSFCFSLTPDHFLFKCCIPKSLSIRTHSFGFLFLAVRQFSLLSLSASLSCAHRLLSVSLNAECVRRTQHLCAVVWTSERNSCSTEYVIMAVVWWLNVIARTWAKAETENTYTLWGSNVVGIAVEAQSPRSTQHLSSLAQLFYFLRPFVITKKKKL